MVNSRVIKILFNRYRCIGNDFKYFVVSINFMKNLIYTYLFHLNFTIGLTLDQTQFLVSILNTLYKSNI